MNPVSRLSRDRIWHRICPRQNIIQDHKLKNWYRAVVTLQHEVARDFLLFLLLTGLRVGEARLHKWKYVDFENEILVVPRELTKGDREHRLPLSTGVGLLRRVRAKCGIVFSFHDLRRTFLTMAEKLDVPTYTLKKLANHSVSSDTCEHEFFRWIPKELVFTCAESRTHFASIRPRQR
ncbi:MAG: tyrosine-type recombinase/integrase [Candidatus Obscuribacterales bacterium]|nr:tyrosine-type recombinase/integrase [Candidatus Obscuribacterales bacterium]